MVLGASFGILAIMKLMLLPQNELTFSITN